MRDRIELETDGKRVRGETDLVLLTLQLCLGSSSRHMSKCLVGRPLSAQDSLARCSDQNRRRQVRRERRSTN